MTVAFNEQRNCKIGFWFRKACFSVGCFVMILGVIDGALVWAEESASQRSSGDSLIIEDFEHPDERGFPQGWGAQRSTVTAHETYMIQEEDGVSFLRAKKANQRVYTKQMTWDPKQHPVLVWRWRLLVA
ncbi:MAG: hypothetical protein VST67_12430, partial [Nitrospirota bacterium]|nr:hypothetical protein [Nitrospirota bacterium]